jgi:hypothetical protein
MDREPIENPGQIDFDSPVRDGEFARDLFV